MLSCDQARPLRTADVRIPPPLSAACWPQKAAQNFRSTTTELTRSLLTIAPSNDVVLRGENGRKKKTAGDAETLGAEAAKARKRRKRSG